MPRLVRKTQRVIVKPRYTGISFWLTLIQVIDRSSRVSFLFGFNELLLLEKTSKPPRLTGNKITNAAIKISPPPNQATNARQR